jgi:phage head maturation protease
MTTREIEYRTTSLGVGARDGTRTIGGYAAVFKKPSAPIGDQFIERISPLALNKSRSDGWPNVLCRFQHSDMMLLGATATRSQESVADRHP